MSLKRILFVDDEVQILEGLQNLLRRQRRKWDLVFCPGGDEALAALAAQPFDVVVTDMRMPGMDGAALLHEVKERYPALARVVLSGHADPDALHRALPVAHQFLSKPCDAEVLRVVIERACNLQAMLADETIRRTIGKLDKLPSVPRTYLQLTDALSRPNVGLADLAAIVEQDPAMSAKVLQLVNSAYFGLPRQMTSIRQAVLYLGTDVLRGLALTADVFAAADLLDLDDFSLDHLQQSSLLTARLASKFLDDKARSESAFTAAIVHDVGQLVLAMGLPSSYAGVHRSAEAVRRPVHEVEREVFGTTHAEIGAYLLGVWGLPFPIVEAVAYHHAPGLVTEGARDVIGAVHVADVLVHEAQGIDPELIPPIDLTFLQSAGLRAALPGWRAIADRELVNFAVRT